MPTSLKKKSFLFVFCLASIAQGMYSTYFVSILTIIERIYQIQSKTAGAILSATEIGQILGSLFIAYYGGRGNKPKWISVCMTLSAVAALISISPHFIQLTTDNLNSNAIQHGVRSDNINSSVISISPSPYLMSDLKLNETQVNFKQAERSTKHLCYSGNNLKFKALFKSIDTPNEKAIAEGKTDNKFRQDITHRQVLPTTLVIAIFSVCLLVIGFGSTAITTLGIPFIDDIISKEESPLYLGLTIALRIFGPALGFILGSFCISLDSDSVFSKVQALTGQSELSSVARVELGGWWLGLVVISLPLLVLAIPMYFLSKSIAATDGEEDGDFGNITYQAAEDHDIGGSHDFPVHLMGLGGDLDIATDQTCFSPEVYPSHPEVLQICPSSSDQLNHINSYKQNIAFEQPTLYGDGMTTSKGQVNLVHVEGNEEDIEKSISAKNVVNQWVAPNVCLVVNYLGESDSTSFAKDVAHGESLMPQKTAKSSSSSTISYAENSKKSRKKQKMTQDKPTIADLSNSLSRLLQNGLLTLRMLSGVLHILPIAGFYTFLPKYLIEQFRVTSSSASVISGLAGILFVGFGAFIGGTVIRVFNVNSKMMTRWIAASALLYAIGMIILMSLSCGQTRLVHFESPEYVSSDCSLSCNCAQDIYNPVCLNGATYVTPCLGGCKASKTIANGTVTYDDCNCSNVTHATINEPGLINTDPHGLNVATPGPCPANCVNIVWYVILFSIFTMIHSSCEVGSMMFNLRCVKQDDRTLALGLITFSSSLLGTIPCSIIYGSIVDFTCVHWDRYTIANGQVDSDPSNHGACRAYDNDSFRYSLHGLTATVMAFAFFVDCIISRRSDKVNFYDCDNDDSKMDIRIGLKKSTETISNH